MIDTRIANRPLVLALAMIFALVVISTRVLPVEYRLWNFAAIGAFALFTGARLALWQSLLMAFSAMLASDLILLMKNDLSSEYMPNAVVYGSIAIYALLAHAFLWNSENPIRIGIVTITASLLFFLVTNFACWFSPLLGYERSFRGLLTCYGMALPFARGTFLSDITFTPLFFATYALLSRIAGTFGGRRLQPAESDCAA